MEIQKIKTLFGQGRYGEALQSIDESSQEHEFMGLCYKILILCLRGEILCAIPLLDHLDQLSSSHEDKYSHFVVLTLKTCLYSYQGKEQAIYKSFNEGQQFLNSLKEHERDQIKEWECWLHYGIAYFYQNNGLYKKPINTHLQSSLEIIEALPEKGGKEWVLRFIIHHFLITNQLEVALEYVKLLKEITADGKHIFSLALVSLVEGAIFWFNGEYKKGLELLNKALPIFVKQDLHVLIVGVYNAFALIFRNKSNFEKSISYGEKAIQLMEKKGFYWPHPWDMIIGTHLVKGDYQSALRHAKQVLTICERNDNQTEVVQRLQQIASIYYRKGDFNDALNWTRRSVELSDTLKDISGQAEGFNIMGNISYQIGNLDQAINYYQQALTFTKEFRDEFGGSGQASNVYQANLASVYSLKGDFDQALELMQTALTWTKKHESSWFDNATYLIIGEILFKKGDYQQARIQLQNSLAICEKYGTPLFSAYTLYYLVLTSSELDELTEAKEYLQRLEQTGKDTADLRVTLQARIARGVFFKKSPRAVMKTKAQEIFKQITEEEIISLDLTVFAMLNLLDILIWELSSTGLKEVFQEIQQLITQLSEIARKQNSFTLEIEVVLIQSQLELINGNVNQAMALLKQAKTITREKNLENHQVRIEKQELVIKSELHKWIELTEQNAPLIERIQQSQVQDYITTALRLARKGSSQEQEIVTSIT
ncbi:MAG: tetratricopeptide repeat protein [Candidatus Hodarchaeales archaeon]|jgi:tetratricopeptide (TPR) repeat protein